MKNSKKFKQTLPVETGHFSTLRPLLNVLPSLILLIGVSQLPLTATPPERLSKTDIRSIAGEYAEVLKNHYIRASDGKKIAHLLHRKISKGQYDHLVLGGELASRLQEDARSVNGDRHIAIRYSPDYILNSRDPEAKKRSEKKSRTLALMRNHGFEELRILSGNIGYLKMNSFEGSREAFETVAAAMSFLGSSYAVIIDLRWNPGGDSRMVQVISSYFLGSEPEILDVFHYREEKPIKQIWSLPHVPGPTLEDKGLYILSSSLTFSAAEGLTYDLQALKRATVVGETTMGGGHAVDTFFIGGRFLAYVPHAISINPVTGKNFQGTGVIPDIRADREQALTVAHIHALKNRIARETDPTVKSALEWALDGLSLQTVRLTASDREAYTGTFGPTKITLEKGSLYYHFGPGKLLMAPIKEDYFLLENFDAFRIKIMKSNGIVSGIRVINKTGGSSDIPRTGK